MKIIYNHFFPLGGFKCMGVGPFIVARYGADINDRDVRHESIHWAQQKELTPFAVPLAAGLAFVIGWWALLALPLFYWLYCLLFAVEFVWCIFDKSRGTRADGKHRKLWRRAYYSMALEREAYAHHNDATYLSKRKWFAWIRHNQ